MSQTLIPPTATRPSTSASAEKTVMIVWPSNAAFGLGRFLGRLYHCRIGYYIFTLGNLFALASIPLALVLFVWKIAPFVATRYRLTNRRIMVERGLSARYERGVELDRFNEIDINVRPGQEWYDAGDLIFRLNDVETFRLPGVSRPEPFRQTCLKAQQAFTGVAKHSPAGPY